MQRRSMMAGMAATLVLGSAATRAIAQPQPVRIVVGFPPGGGFDTVARQLATPFQTLIDRPVVVENRTGAAGRIALDYLKHAPKNGEVIAVAHQGVLTLSPYVYKNVPFDPVKDFTPITRLVTFDYCLAVGTAVPATNLADYLKWLRDNPTKAAHGSSGNGTTPHLLGVWFHQKIGVPAIHVPYRGTPPIVIDLVGGRLPSSVNTVGDLLEQHRAGKVRILATMGATRNAQTPDIPTLKESGIDIVVPGWVGLYGPGAMDPRVVQSYNEMAVKALATPALRDSMAGLGWSVSPTTSADMGKIQRDELAAWAPIVKASGIQPEE
jgi:tripartite-type tricarboxylate transporter receptor subunit TctC